MRIDTTYGPGPGLGAEDRSVSSGDVGEDCGSPDGRRAKDLRESVSSASLMQWNEHLVKHTVSVAETVAVSTASVMVVVPVLLAAIKQLHASRIPSRPRSSLYSGRQLGETNEEEEEEKACLATRPTRLVVGHV